MPTFNTAVDRQIYGVGKNKTANRESGWPLRRRTDEKIIRLELVTANFLPTMKFLGFKNSDKITYSLYFRYLYIQLF